MNRHELKRSILAIAELINLNRQIVTRERLVLLEDLLVLIRQMVARQAQEQDPTRDILKLLKIDHQDFEALLQMAESIVYFEKQLTQPGKQEALQKFLEKLSEKPFLLATIAMFC